MVKPKTEEKPDVIKQSEFKGEKEICSYDSLTLTNKRIIKKKASFSEDNIEEIPLNKISSIVYTSMINMRLIVFGILLLIFGLLIASIPFIKDFEAVGSLPIIFIVVSIVLIIWGIVDSNNVLIFGSSSLKIVKSSKRSELKSFLNKVRKEIYK